MVQVLTIETEVDSVSKLGYPTTLDCDPNTKDIVIRWGRGWIDGPEEFRRVINPARAIKLNCNKLKALMKMSKVVNVPQIFTKKVPGRQLVLKRPINHTNGENFKVVRGPIKIGAGFYGTSWINTKLEYRVWFAGGKTLCAARIKVELNPNTDELEVVRSRSKYPCRSGWGYDFIKSTPKRLHAAVLRAAKAIGLQLGAADVLVKNRRYYFVELNSAPTIDDSRITEFFKTNIDRLIK